MVEIIGIDFGAKLSGKTAVAYATATGEIHFLQCEKKVDADVWLCTQIAKLQPITIYIDAPLSLPAAYYGKGNNFHYREADTITKAMSPMFLGGLTARAMAIKYQLTNQQFIEIYPAYYQSKIIQSTHYKLDISSFMSDLNAKENFRLKTPPSNWHQVDALLALLIGKRHQNGQHLSIGNPEEGQIMI